MTEFPLSSLNAALDDLSNAHRHAAAGLSDARHSRAVELAELCADAIAFCRRLEIVVQGDQRRTVAASVTNVGPSLRWRANCCLGDAIPSAERAPGAFPRVPVNRSYDHALGRVSSHISLMRGARWFCDPSSKEHSLLGRFAR